MKKDSIGDRMKTKYEDKTRFYLPLRTYTIIRLDGQAFHTFCRNFKRPFDDEFMDKMDEMALYLCKNIPNTRFAFIQSDEISILLTDFNSNDTSQWFDGNLQKMCSISASMAAGFFNFSKPHYDEIAKFDSRVFTISTDIEVENYFIWRQKDIERNSIQMVAQVYYCQKELDGKKVSDLHDMIHNKGDNWNDYLSKYKRGRMITKDSDDIFIINHDVPIFTQQREFLREMIPALPSIGLKETE